MWQTGKEMGKYIFLFVNYFTNKNIVFPISDSWAAKVIISNNQIFVNTELLADIKNIKGSLNETPANNMNNE